MNPLTTIAEALPDFLADAGRRGLRANTIRAYRADLTAAAAALTDPIAVITADQIDACLAARGVVSRMLGHRDPRSTRRYAAVHDEQVRAALAGRRRR